MRSTSRANSLLARLQEEARANMSKMSLAEKKYPLLIGLALTLPACALLAYLAIRFWQVTLVGITLFLVVAAVLVAAVISAVPVAYVLCAIYYALQPPKPTQAVHYSLEQGKEVGLRSEDPVRPGETDAADDQRAE